MDLDHERRHLAQTNRHIAELRTHIARQRIIVQAAIHRGRPSPEGESYLEVLEGSLRTFERHRCVILRFIKNWPPQIKHRPARRAEAPGQMKAPAALALRLN